MVQRSPIDRRLLGSRLLYIVCLGCGIPLGFIGVCRCSDGSTGVEDLAELWVEFSDSSQLLRFVWD